VVVVGGLVGGVVVGGTVVGGAVVGVGVVGGVLVGEGDVAGGDLLTDGTVVGDEAELVPPALVVDGDVVVGLVLVLVLVLVPAPPVEVAPAAGLTADDFPSESTANHSFSTPCPAAWPFLVSLTKRYSA
jgi:hypothetical protein